MVEWNPALLMATLNSNELLRKKIPTPAIAMFVHGRLLENGPARRRTVPPETLAFRSVEKVLFCEDGWAWTRILRVQGNDQARLQGGVQ